MLKQTKTSFAILALVAANLVPLLGVLIYGWDVAVIVLLYWTENVIVGLYNILKIAFVKVESPILHAGKLLAIPFFCVHYGGFCAGHVFFIIAFFMSSDTGPLFPRDFWSGLPAGMGWSVAFLFVSHGISFVQNYIGKKEYASLSIGGLFAQPYKRVVILHVAIIFGGGAIMFLGSPVPLLCILVLLKVCLDIRLHMQEHAVNADAEVEPSI